MDGVELGDPGAYEETTVLIVGEVCPDKNMEMGGAAQGAAALCGGGEPK